MQSVKKIKSLKVVKAGSPPDIDSDVNTFYREKLIDYISETYGHDNVSSIITFTTLAAKAAFKEMCTIYNIPFSQAQAITDMIPDPIEGVNCTIDDLYNPESERYSEGEEFRMATSDPKWRKIIEGAKNIESRNKANGVHACGLLISAKPLKEIIPLHVRQTDGRVISQFTYPAAESLGLTKMDILGLDTVDLIQHSVEYIQKNGKKAPNMLEIIHGEKNDEKTFDLIRQGKTIGIFQLASPGVQDLLKRMKPTKFEDIVATTALYRPGPMGMQSHIKYADRKNGREEIDSIHPEFKGSPLDEILGSTYGICIYQEQILKIANRIAGMTLQEGDELRSAMGKKKKHVMERMKPIFMEGGQANGYSLGAMTRLWDTIALFAKYGFNLSHSVAYGLNAYQAAYLKANYPIEFMAALLAQNSDKKEKLLEFLKEARTMGLKIGTVDINASDVRVSPDYQNKTNFDIIIGFGSLKSVTEEMAQIIVDERERNGNYKDIKDLINRCYPLGIKNRTIYENIILAGGFDKFPGTRLGMVNAVGPFLTDAKKTATKGVDLFSMFETQDEDDSSLESIDFESIGEYSFIEKIKREADVIGLYLTEHPLSRAGEGLSAIRNSTIEELNKNKEKGTYTLVGCATEIEKKKLRNGGQTITITIDDGTGYVKARFAPDIVKAFLKHDAQEKIKTLYEAGVNDVPEAARKLISMKNIIALDPLKTNVPYVMKVSYRPALGDSPAIARIVDIRPLQLSYNGLLPVRLRFKINEENTERIKKLYRALPANLNKKIPGEYPIWLATYKNIKNGVSRLFPTEYIDAIIQMDKDTKNNVVHKAKEVNKKTVGLNGEEYDNTKKKKGAIAKEVKLREWPPPKMTAKTTLADIEKEQHAQLLSLVIERMPYKETSFTTEKTDKSKMAIERFIGLEDYDFGSFNSELLK